MQVILVVLFVFLFLVLSSPLMLIEHFIGKKHPDTKSRSSLAIVNWAFRIVKFLSGTKIIVKGLENVPEDKPVLYMGNHRSFYDVVLTYPLVKRPTGYIAKKEIEKVPLLRVWMRDLHCLFLDRQNLKEGVKTTLTAIEMIKEGKSMCIFPEGTRCKEEGTLLPFHEGSFKIATKAGVPIIPMTIVNSGNVLEDHFPWIKRTTVVIEYGTPIETASLTKEEQKALPDTLHDIILSTYEKDLELIPEKHRPGSKNS